MKRFRSWTGALFALLYAAPIAYAYVDYRRHAGTWLADLMLAIVVLPFTLTMRWLSGGDFDFAGDMTARVVAAALFCCALAYLLGLVLEMIVRAIVRAIVGR